MILFYDTCSLLSAQKKAFEAPEKFYISSITLKELENIKTSGTKDEETKYKARTLLNLLDKYEDKYEVILYHNSYASIIEIHDFENIPDNKIIACACHLKDLGNDIMFITEDKVCKETASALGLKVLRQYGKEEEEYTGFKKVIMNEKELATFYEHIYPHSVNRFGLLNNEYLLLEIDNEIVAKYKWCDEHYIEIPFQKAESKMFGKVVPKDHYQQIALDSLHNNQITMLRGAAGSGKSYLAFSYMFSLLEKGKISKIIIFCNTVATKGSAKLGYYPGSREEKLLDSQIGNLLVSKLGDRSAVERMINDGSLVLLPMSDIRGYDTTGMNAAVYISEAQNLDIELARLALQRVSDDAICILDGDSNAQVDLSLYAGNNNGMRRISEVFKGSDFYGEVTLQNIYRGKIANLAQQL